MTDSLSSNTGCRGLLATPGEIKPFISKRNNFFVAETVPNRDTIVAIYTKKPKLRVTVSLLMTTDLEKFTECIVPCGLDGFTATSLERELGKNIPSLAIICAAVTVEIAKGLFIESDAA